MSSAKDNMIDDPTLTLQTNHEGGSTLGRVCAHATIRKLIAPKWAAPSFEPIRGFEYTPEPPRYSSLHLQQVNNILSNNKAQEELLLEDINTTFKSRDEQVYKHYVAYCKSLGIEPRTIEDWHPLRDEQTISPELKVKALPYTVDVVVSPERTLEASRRSNVKHPHNFLSMVTEKVGMSRLGFGHNTGNTTKELVRVAVVREDFSGYVWQNRTGAIKLEVRGPSLEIESCICCWPPKAYSQSTQRHQYRFLTVMLVNVAKPAPIEVACLRRGIEQPITFDKHLQRAAFRPSLQDVNKLELTIAMIWNRPFGYWNPFEYRPDYTPQIPKRSRVTRDLLLPHVSFKFKVKEGTLLLPHESLWCKTCIERVVLTTIDGVDIVLEQEGKFVGQDPWYDEEGILQSHQHIVPTISNDSMSLDRLQGWLNHRTKRGATSRLWTYAHPVVEGDAPAQLAVPVVSRTLSPYGSPVLPGGGVFGDLNEECTHSRTRMLCRVCNESYLTRLAERFGYLPAPRCKHTDKQSFTFTRSETIKMCPDCTRFDAARQDLLRVGTIPQPNKEMREFYDCVLEQHAKELSSKWDTETLDGGYQLCRDCGDILINGAVVLARHCGYHFHTACNPTKHPLDLSAPTANSGAGLDKEHLSYYAPSTLLSMTHAIVKEKLVGGKRVSLHSSSEKNNDRDEWVETLKVKGKLFNPTEDRDYGVRDHRAHDIATQDRPDKKAKTQDVRVAKWCPYSQCPRKGEPFIDRPNKKYCSENCRKRYNEEKNAV